MRILFTPAGDTDPVRGNHDGAILHILRHYKVDRVILVLTREMEEKEKEMSCYAQGIESVSPDTELSYVCTGITEPQKFEALTGVQDAFDEAYRTYPDAEWLLNISSGTPQLKTVMALFAMDYPDTRAIQVASPEKGSNRDNHPCRTAEELVEMLECNEDSAPEAKNRCEEPPLSLLKRHGVTRQIISLAKNYEYASALQLLRQNRNCGFSEETEKLLQHAAYRRNLQWKEANKVISTWEGKPLMESPDDFSEYFRVMEMQVRKKQYAEFIIKLSPILMPLGEEYLKSLPHFDLVKCGCKDERGIFKLYVEDMNANYPGLVSSIERKCRERFRNGLPISFINILWICEYLKEKGETDARHEKVTEIFEKLRVAEEQTRNLVAHQITNLTDDEIKRRTGTDMAGEKGIPGGLSAGQIMNLLHEAVRLIRKKDIRWNYDELNDIIISSLRKR